MKPILIRLIYWMAMATLASTAAADDSAAEQLQSGSLIEAVGGSAALSELGPNLIETARTFSSSFIAGPSSGTILGVSALAVFIVLIWMIIYSVGVVPVTPAGRSIRETVRDQLPFVYQRIQRDLNQVSSSVMDAIDKYSSQQQL